MPLYEFRCETCGVFEQLRSLSQSSLPMLCPTCATTAKRIIYSAPGLIATPSALSRRIEQSAEPKVVARQDHEHKHQHHTHAHQSRPWMVGH